MEIKGTAVKSTQKFVKENFPDRYEEWIASLSENSRNIYKDIILSGNWYPLIDAIILPTEKIGEIFYNSEIKQLAYDIGKASALQALSGVYKIFVRIASLEFVLKRIKTIFSTYYSTGVFKLVKNDKRIISFEITGFKKGEELIFERIAGWVDGIFNIVSNKTKQVDYTITNKDNNFIEATITVIIL